LKLGGKKQFLVIAALTDAKSLQTLRAHAFAIRATARFDWTFDAAAGIVHTKWTVKTEPLGGQRTSGQSRLLPHHYRGGSWGLRRAISRTPRRAE
jgi:hypothetical protein